MVPGWSPPRTLKTPKSLPWLQRSLRLKGALFLVLKLTKHFLSSSDSSYTLTPQSGDGRSSLYSQLTPGLDSTALHLTRPYHPFITTNLAHFPPATHRDPLQRSHSFCSASVEKKSVVRSSAPGTCSFPQPHPCKLALGAHSGEPARGRRHVEFSARARRPSTRLSARDGHIGLRWAPACGGGPTPARRRAAPRSALTDHLLQLVVVPVDGPGQGARVLRHDGRGAWLRAAPHARGSTPVSSPPLRALPTPSRSPSPAAGPSLLGALDARECGSSAADLASRGSAPRSPQTARPTSRPPA